MTLWSAGRAIEQGAGRIERHDGRRHLADAAPSRARRGDRVDGAQRVAMAVVERDGIAGADEVVLDGDDAAGEEALVELPGVARDVDGAVLADAAAKVLEERGGEHRLVDGAALRRGPRVGRRLADEAAVRCEVVVIGDERVE